MSDEGTLTTKCRILNILSELDYPELESVEEWILSSKFKKDLKNKRQLMHTANTLNKISKSISKMVSFEAVMPSEQIVYPTVGDQADCNSHNTLHVDEFLYDQNKVDELIKGGKLKSHYCLDCNSRNIKDLIYVSHSKSKQVLQYIFKVLLPSDLEDKKVLDVGSRLGAVLYGAYYLTNASTIIGVEMNKEFCELQEKIIDKYSIDKNRVKVICSDIIDRCDIVCSCNIVIMNVFDFFVDTEKHKDMWRFFKRHLKKGSYLVLNRNIDETLGSLGIAEEFMNWLSICRPFQLENEIFFDVEDCCELFLYTIN